jgi:hypothetical protein
MVDVGERERRDSGMEREGGRRGVERECVRVHIDKCSIIHNLGHVEH